MKHYRILACIFLLVSVFLSSCDDGRNVHDYTVKENVTVIKSNDFSKYSNLTSITFGKNVELIEGSAFANCKNLENVYYEGTILDWCKIEFQNAKSNPLYFADNFYLLENGNYKLASEITLPSNLSSLKPYSFAGFEIDRLNIPKSILSYGENAFKECYVSDIYFYGTLRDWCKIEFANSTSTPVCESSIIYMYDENNEFTYITDTLVIPSDVTKINDYQFTNFFGVDKIILPNSVKKIGKYAFILKTDINNKIKSLHFNGTLLDWLKIEFEGRLSNPMEISERVYMLNETNEYYEFTTLDTIRISNEITKLGDYQFAGIANLDNLYISNSIKEIGKNVFGNYQSIIENLYFEGTVIDWCEIDFIDKYTLAYDANNIYFKENKDYVHIEGELIVPKEVSEIKNNQFSGFRKLERVIFSEGLTRLGSNVFHNCYGLKELILPTSLLEIGEECTYGCSKFERIYYLGNQQQFDSISKSNIGGEVFYYSEHEPEDTGNYWHYDEDNIVIW